MYVNLPDKPMPPAYQQYDVKYVYSSLRAGQSCSLIGIGSVGKSNLMQHLTRDDVKAHHLSDKEAPYLLTVYLDPHTLIDVQAGALEAAGKAWAGYELMLSRFIYQLQRAERAGTLKKKKTEDALSDWVQAVYDRLYESDPLVKQSGLRYIEQAVLDLLRENDRWQIAFLFDEVTEFMNLSPRFFLSLRGLRDAFKGRVMYVTTSRVSLYEGLVDPTPESLRPAITEFTELFGDHTRYISPLDEESASAVIERYIKRYQNDFDIYKSGKQFLSEDVYEVTGGHVGLMRRSFRPAVRYLIDKETMPLKEYLLLNDSVRAECDELIASLTNEERDVLHGAIRGNSVSDMNTWQNLFEKHIIIHGKRGADFCFPLLGEYIMREPDMLVGDARIRR
jgi:hypothetical protein